MPFANRWRTREFFDTDAFLLVKEKKIDIRMYGIIYFPEDHTLSTIKESHRDLSTTSFEAGSHCVMKWGSKHFDGIIVKTGGKWDF